MRAPEATANTAEAPKNYSEVGQLEYIKRTVAFEGDIDEVKLQPIAINNNIFSQWAKKRIEEKYPKAKFYSGFDAEKLLVEYVMEQSAEVIISDLELAVYKNGRKTVLITNGGYSENLMDRFYNNRMRDKYFLLYDGTGRYRVGKLWISPNKFYIVLDEEHVIYTYCFTRSGDYYLPRYSQKIDATMKNVVEGLVQRSNEEIEAAKINLIRSLIQPMAESAFLKNNFSDQWQEIKEKYAKHSFVKSINLNDGVLKIEFLGRRGIDTSDYYDNIILPPCYIKVYMGDNYRIEGEIGRHPHILGGGDLCLGDLSGIVSRAARTFDFMGLIDSICYFANHITTNDFSGESRDTRFRMENFLTDQKSDITDEELLAMFGDGIKLEEIYYQLQTQYNCYQVIARKTNLFRSLFDENGNPKLNFPDESYFFKPDAEGGRIRRWESESNTDETYADRIKNLIIEAKTDEDQADDDRDNEMDG